MLQSRAIRMLRRDRGAWAGLAIVLVSLFLAAFPFLLRLPEPAASDLNIRLLRPFSGGHLLGTDQLGRDLLSRLIWGVRPALIQGLLSVALAAVIGYALGALAGFFGGLPEFITMRLVDMLLAIPPVMMAIAVAATLGPGLRNVVIAMTLVLIAPMARVARGAVLGVKDREYVVAARSIGARNYSILLRHIVPNTLSPVIAYAIPLIGIMIVFGSGLSFIGLGVPPPKADWGRMVNESRTILSTSPYLATLPGLAIFLLGLGFNLMGDWVDELLDPRSSRR